MTYLNFIGFMAAAFTTIGFIPQTIKVLKTRQTKDISLWMYVLFVSGVVLWLIYGIMSHAWPIILANIVTLALGLTILIFKIIYK